jgi:hypothetical protein
MPELRLTEIVQRVDQDKLVIPEFQRGFKWQITITKRLADGFPDFDQVRDATSKASLIFRTLMAFNLARTGVDWAGSVRSATDTQEDHHIFPRDWLQNNRDQTKDKQVWVLCAIRC